MLILCYSILSQLTESRLALFPAILTRKCACDMAIVSLLRGWTRDNSPSALWNQALEIHSKEWMRIKQLRLPAEELQPSTGLQG